MCHVYMYVMQRRHHHAQPTAHPPCLSVYMYICKSKATTTTTSLTYRANLVGDQLHQSSVETQPRDEEITPVGVVVFDDDAVLDVVVVDVIADVVDGVPRPNPTP